MNAPRWLFVAGDGSVPAGTDWLAPAEERVQSQLRFAPRRAAWRIGRWTAKRALLAWLGEEESPEALARLAVLADPAGIPRAFRDGEPLPISLSLSHRSGAALAALVAGADGLGCDLEQVERRDRAFVDDVFTAAEREQIDAAPPAAAELTIALLWSGKESALKAAGVGLRVDTRAVEIELELAPSFGPWRPFSARGPHGHLRSGWWQRRGDLVLTVAGPVGLPTPVSLRDDD